MLFDGLLPRVLPAYAPPALRPGERGLVLGMGGGCDVFAAWAVAREWQAAAGSAGEVLFGNACAPRHVGRTKAERPEAALEEILPNLYRSGAVLPLILPGDGAYGTLKLELSLPSPYVFAVPHGDVRGDDDLTKLDPMAAEAANGVWLAGCLAALGPVTHVVAVDCGGDSLTGGVDFLPGGSMEMGRDRQVLHALGANGVSFDHMVLGPGCDAESSVEVRRII